MNVIMTAGGFRFHCTTEAERWRAETFRTKEPGTLAWLRETVREGDIVWDVGANVGCYTLLAASLVGDSGKVYAFEPHVGNAAALVRNVCLNKLAHRVVLVTGPLHDEDGWFAFNYANPLQGYSGSQLGHTRSERGKEFIPALAEQKWATTGNAFTKANSTAWPNVAKVDVDGNEMKVLFGMGFSLNRIRSLQVEVHPGDADGVVAWLTARGLTFSHRHDTAKGQELLAAGTDPARVTHNQVWVRGTV